MKPTAELAERRRPKQKRSRETVEAVLDAVVRLLRSDGIQGVTTNRIAEVAGVSIGSLYQYFPDKRAIFQALHDRHVAAVGRVIDRTLVDHAASTLEDFVRALVSALVDAHDDDDGFHQLMATEVPNGGSSRALEERLRGTFRLAILARATPRHAARDIDKMLFVLPVMVEALAHGVGRARPARLSIAAAKEEAVRAVVAYLRASGWTV